MLRARDLVDHRSTAAARLSIVALVLFPAIVAGLAMLLVIDRAAYLEVLKEDHPVEWLTAAFDALAGVVALHLAFTAPVRRRWWAALALFCFFVALEEISWGQRVLHLASPDFFARHSDQSEINVHNVAQQWSGLTSKLIGGIVLFAYGVALPIAARMRATRDRVARLPVVVPPASLVGGFLLASLLMFDKPTTNEEEIAELLFALCFVFLTAFGEVDARQAKKEGTDRRPVPSDARSSATGQR